HEISDRPGLHLPHHLAAVGLHRDLADAELAADLLVQTARDDECHDLALAPAERGVTLPQRLQFRLTVERAGAALDGTPDGVYQHVILERFPQELCGARLHRAYARRDIAMA